MSMPGEMIMKNRKTATKATTGALGLCFTLVFALSSAPSANSNDAKAASDAILQQISKYAAALDKADVDVASQVWQTSADVSFIHPSGHAHGWEEVREIYKFFGSAFSDRTLTVRDASVHVNGDTAWAEFYWDFVAKQTSDGSSVNTTGRETQIYYKIGDSWRLVHVHYSGPARKR